MPASAIDCDALREQLLAPDPMQRVMALHALEVEVARGGPRPLANEVMRFTERGIPFYCLHDPHFCDWVSKAVSYWQRLHAMPVAANDARARRGRKKLSA
ncbi:MAG TPA: hypothetical protein VKI18_15195 [Albitalea sp.]|nr:hypothetical protein [Albitalea sp.]